MSRTRRRSSSCKTDVDVLTLTATPIPRTLHMSLIGIRDMSVLEEAPQERVPIQTYVMEYNEEMVREAISRELAQGRTGLLRLQPGQYDRRDHESDRSAGRRRHRWRLHTDR